MDKSEQQRFNSKQLFNSEALFNAAKKGILNRVQQIIANGPVDLDWGSPDAKFYGQTALIVAIRKGHQDIAEFLIGIGANVNKGCRYNFTPLMYAVIEKSVPMVEMLLSHGANPNIPNINRNTPLHSAVWQGNQPMVEALLIGGANPDIRDQSGFTARRIAELHRPGIVIDIPKINTLNTMYVMQEGLAEANVFNRMDPQSLTDLNEYYGGKKRTNRRRTNKRRTNKRRTNRTQ